MKATRLLGAAAVAVAFATPTAALAQDSGCSTDGTGSAVGAPAECPPDEAPEVLGEVDVNEEPPTSSPVPDPAPIPVTAPEVLTATGVDSDVLVIAAVGAIALGGGAVFASRRKKIDA